MGVVLLSARRLAPWQVDKWRLVHVGLATALLAAGALKTWELARGLTTLDQLWFGRRTLTFFVLFELAFAVWLLANICPRLNRIAALIVFLGFFELNVYLAASGATSCPCLGGIHINPWVMAVFDALVVVILVLVTPAPRASAPVPRHRLGAALAAYAFLGGAALLLVVNAPRRHVNTDLRADSGLRQSVSVDLTNPDNKRVLEILRDNTGRAFTMDATFEQATANLGRIKTTLPAWAIMAALAEKQSTSAQWVKTAEGYHLSAPAGWPTRLLGVLIGVGAIVLIAVGLRLCRSGRRMPVDSNGGLSGSVNGVAPCVPATPGER